jgi:hypothetical protein
VALFEGDEPVPRGDFAAGEAANEFVSLPAPIGPSVSRRTSWSPFCHCGALVWSATNAKTSAIGREISTVVSKLMTTSPRVRSSPPETTGFRQAAFAA